MPPVPVTASGRPWCALCGSGTVGRVRSVELPYGVVVRLCAPHATPAFLTRDHGRVAAAALERAWISVGCLDHRRRRSLETYVRRLSQPREPQQRRRPGSYAWPDVRQQVAQMRDRGERFESVMEWVRHVCTDERTSPPSSRTVRRWWRDTAWSAPYAP